MTKKIIKTHLNKPFGNIDYEKKVDLSDQMNGFYGEHRSGWPFVLRVLSRLHQPGKLALDSFIERTFCWHPDGPRSREVPWIGFIHVPPNVPDWFQSEQSNDFIFNTDLWKKSYPYCRGLFTLSGYHRKALEKKLDVPVNNLLFPTETPDVKWDWDKFNANKEKKIVQVGWWLRKLHAIFLLPTRSYKKVFLRITHADIDSLLKRERALLEKESSFDPAVYDSAEALEFVPNKQYDRLLSENIPIVYLYDSSANNTVIECIVRNTPLLVNRLESVVEYLGEDYPFYFDSLEEAAEKAENTDLIYKTHMYLVNYPDKHKLSGEFFLDSFVNTEIYKGIG